MWLGKMERKTNEDIAMKKLEKRGHWKIVRIQQSEVVRSDMKNTRGQREEARYRLTSRIKKTDVPTPNSTLKADEDDVV